MPTLITDLAIILICAGTMTLLFKWLKQPVVLGYIVAGMIAGPHLFEIFTVSDTENVHIWSEIGVIFLLFALGLEFSFKKIVKVGSSAAITAITIIIGMIVTGISVGAFCGWSNMDCIFLGGMVAMSSTTIIFKAYGDMGLREKQFAQLVLSVLILEDILAIVLMVVLSTLAVSGEVEGMQLAYAIGKMIFFIILWFLIGIYFVPMMLRRMKSLLNDETMLIFALGLCFLMVVFADAVDFSPAFGAFIMGSILAETLEAEKIHHLVKPVHDLFGAVFFVSVGMMVDPLLIMTYWKPIFAIIATVILGQTFFGTLGILLAGKGLKTALQGGFSLTQIGEFAFIIAGLGISLNVTSEFLYPVVVAVSVITTFLTPYMMRLALPLYNLLCRMLPKTWIVTLDSSVGARTMNAESRWHSVLMGIFRTTAIYLVLVIAIEIIMVKGVSTYIIGWLPGAWGNWLSAAVTLFILSPFLRAIITSQNQSDQFQSLWRESHTHRAKLIATIVLRIMLVMGMMMTVMWHFMRWGIGLLIVFGMLCVVLIVMAKKLRRQTAYLESKFIRNLNSREMAAEAKKERRPEYEARLLSHDLHISDYRMPIGSIWCGHTLAELSLGRKTGIHIVSIVRGSVRYNIPGGDMRLFPGDRLQVIGTDAQCDRFQNALEGSTLIDEFYGKHTEKPEPTTMRCLSLTADHIFVGKTVLNCRSREDFHLLIVGIERHDEELHVPARDEQFRPGDVLWLVGEEKDLYRIHALVAN